jgi:hypothetical protein
MSEFDNLKGDAEKYAKDHPQQVQEAEHDAEHAVESKFGDGGQQGQDSQQGGQQAQDGGSGQATSQQDNAR